MSIRLIARELYQAKQKVEKLEKELADTPFSQQDDVKERLRIARAELRQLESIMAGAKKTSGKLAAARFNSFK